MFFKMVTMAFNGLQLTKRHKTGKKKFSKLENSFAFGFKKLAEEINCLLDPFSCKPLNILLLMITAILPVRSRALNNYSRKFTILSVLSEITHSFHY